jgi:putative ABC transport system substrate-binding protein
VLGGAAAWPLAADAQQQAVPVIGLLLAGSIDDDDNASTYLAGFRKGLSETGFVEGRNLSIEYRWANNRFDRLPELAADLVRRQVAVIATPSSTAAALAAKAATTTIPIVFGVLVDPIRTGLVTRINRPGGNITGINYLSGDVASKRLGLLHELLPRAKRFGVLVNPTSPLAPFLEDMRPVAAAFGGEIDLLTASTSGEIDTAFASLAERRIDALLLTVNALFASRRVQIVTLAARLGVPESIENNGPEYAL